MKNLPEKDFWKAIRNRLENYSEDPQDDWYKIAGAIPSSTPRNRNVNVAADLLSGASLVFLLWTLFSITPSENTTTPDPLQGQSAVSEKILRRLTDRLKADTNIHIEPEHNIVVPDKKEPTRNGHVYQNNLKKTAALKSRQHKVTGGVVSENGPEPLLIQRPDDVAVHSKDITAPPDRINNSVRESGSTLIEADSARMDTSAETDTVFFTVPPILQKKAKPKKKFKPSVYAMVTPSFAYQKIIPMRNDDVNVQNLNSPGIFSADRFGFAMEAGFQMQVSNYFELYTTLSYYHQQQSVSYNFTSDTGMQVAGTNNSWSYQLSPGEATHKFNYSMKNAGVAGGILYHLRGRKLMHKIGAGLQYQKGLISSGGEYSYNNAASSYFNYQLMYRMEYSLSGRASFFFQPLFIHSIISSESLNEPFDIKPYRAGMGFGLVYHLY